MRLLIVITFMLFVPLASGSLRLNTEKCWKMDTLGCLELADQAWRDRKYQEALDYSKRGCDLGDSYTCGFYGYLLWETGDPLRASSFLKLACEDQQDRYCEMYQDLYLRVFVKQ